MKIHYKRNDTIIVDCEFTIEDENNVFLKSKYNYCNADTNPHFAQFIDGKDVVTVFVEKYHDISVQIRRTSNKLLNSVELRKFIEKQKGDVQIITREEFFEYYNGLTKI